jgi:methanol--5-hydroxybenzimidazolylcobamide Co-methyltransferase
VPDLLVEFETLPEMMRPPSRALEIATDLSERLEHFHSHSGLRSALRLTPNDIRDFARPPLLRRGPFWEAMVETFGGAAGAGADLLAIESTGGKEVSDEALLTADLEALLLALGVLAPRDTAFLWEHVVAVCRSGGVIPSGDSACAFANTAMTLAEQRLVPRVFAAVVRVAAVPRSLVAYEAGAVGPSKDCAYEGPYIKALTGVPISMEGRTAAVAHLSPVGNIAQAVCDCWSNESVQNVRLLSTYAPTVSLEQLAYDCRLMNVAAADPGGALVLRDWLVSSDASRDPQAWVLRPDVVLRIAQSIAAAPTPYARTRIAVLATLDELGRASIDGRLQLPALEVRWLERLRAQAVAIPEEEERFLEQALPSFAHRFIPAEYGLPDR